MKERTKTITFQPTKSEVALIKKTMTEKRISQTEAIHWLFAEGEFLRDQTETKLANLKQEFPQCWGNWLIYDIQINFYDCINPKPLVKRKYNKTGLIPQCCEKCNEEFEKLKEQAEELRLYPKIVGDFQNITGRKRISQKLMIVGMNQQIETLEAQKIDAKSLHKRKINKLTELYNGKLSKLTAERDTARTQLNALRQDHVELQELDQQFAEKKHLLNEIKAFESLKHENVNLKAQNEKLLTEKDTLKSRVSLMENTLLSRDKKIASLEVDNEQLRLNVEKLSESKLLDENDSLRTQLAQKNTLINEYKDEIRKVEAVRQEELKLRHDVISKVSQMLRNFKEFAPSTKLEIYEAISYLKSVRQHIENMEGYLKTIEPREM